MVIDGSIQPGWMVWRRRFWSWLLALAVLPVWAAAPGCSGVDCREWKSRNAALDRLERRQAGRGFHTQTYTLIARHGLLISAFDDPGPTAQRLESELAARPERGGLLALAELWYHQGLQSQSREPAHSLRCYRDAATLAALSLGDPGEPAPEAALMIHNGAVARLIRVMQRSDVRGERPWHDALARVGMVPTTTSPVLQPGGFETLAVADDFIVSGIRNVYRRVGLGVPCVARTPVERVNTPVVQNRYYPTPLLQGTTARVVPGGSLADGSWRQTPATLVFHDAFEEGPVVLGGRTVPLAFDRTTPLARQSAGSILPELELIGLLTSNFKGKVESGIFMLRPYEPGKIPVVFVHGLNSSPRAWLQTLNEMASDRELSARYQFWVFLYPTGRPIPGSAALLRQALLQARQDFDPAQTDAAFDQMVLVGHSMGGLLSKMMVQRSGSVLWDAAFNVPYDRLKGPEEIRTRLASALFYEPIPFVRRVVFVATPHRGSLIANRFIGRMTSRLMAGPDEQAKLVARLEEANGPGVISPVLKGNALGSVDELRTDSPVLAALNRIPIEPDIPYHSVIPQITGQPGGTDGVVPYRSSHLEGAVSEQVITGTHSAQQSAAATTEIKRILRLHLTETNGALLAGGKASQDGRVARASGEPEPSEADLPPPVEP